MELCETWVAEAVVCIAIGFLIASIVCWFVRHLSGDE
jgi:hypothetical protein